MQRNDSEVVPGQMFVWSHDANFTEVHIVVVDGRRGILLCMVLDGRIGSANTGMSGFCKLKMRRQPETQIRNHFCDETKIRRENFDFVDSKWRKNHQSPSNLLIIFNIFCRRQIALARGFVHVVQNFRLDHITIHISALMTLGFGWPAGVHLGMGSIHIHIRAPSIFTQIV